MRRLFILLPLIAPGGLSAQAMDQTELLRQMADLRWLTQPDPVPFRQSQASSYDRKSVRSGVDSWFANGDYGQYVRVEQNNGRTEYVMADLKGPGVVDRIWSANPLGTIRFYYDGEAKPRLTESMPNLLSGKVQPWSDTFAYTASHGWNLYFPFPYRSSLKITVEPKKPEDAAGLYYHVGYRTYPAGTKFSGADLQTLSTVRAMSMTPAAPTNRQIHVEPGQKRIRPRAAWDSGKVSTPGTITSLTVKIPFPLVQTFRAMDWGDPHQPHNVLQNLQLEITCDGELCVRSPLGSFFGTSPGVNAYKSLPMEVAKDGTMTSRWPMPVRRDFHVRILNTGSVEVPISASWNLDPSPVAADAYHFHAQWNGTRGHTRPLRDMHILDVHGQGRFVGVSLHVANPTQKWWGEGDEKVWVDDESFPSTFGTGTEDYFGYAWSSNELFDRPYHGQVRSDGPINFGHSTVHRWQILDNIPFTKHLQFDLEMWHWGDVEATYDWTAYWYAKPGGDGHFAIPQSLALPQELVLNSPVPGAVEGEILKYTATGGEVQAQTGFDELSAGGQLWWTRPKEQDTLTVKIPVAKKGRYEVIARFCNAVDYGIHNLNLNGQDLGRMDFYIPQGVVWRNISLGTFDLDAGESTLTVRCLGKRTEAHPGNMFGLDYILLKKK